MDDLTTEMSSQSTAVVATADAQKGKAKDFTFEEYAKVNEGEDFRTMEELSKTVLEEINNSSSEGIKSHFNCFAIGSPFRGDETVEGFEAIGKVGDFFERNHQKFNSEKTLAEKRFFFIRFCLVMSRLKEKYQNLDDEKLGELATLFIRKPNEYFFLREKTLFTTALIWKRTYPGQLKSVSKQFALMIGASKILFEYCQFYISLAPCTARHYEDYHSGRVTSKEGNKKKSYVYSVREQRSHNLNQLDIFLGHKLTFFKKTLTGSVRVTHSANQLVTIKNSEIFTVENIKRDILFALGLDMGESEIPETVSGMIVAVQSLYLSFLTYQTKSRIEFPQIRGERVNAQLQMQMKESGDFDSLIEGSAEKETKPVASSSQTNSVSTNKTSKLRREAPLFRLPKKERDTTRMGHAC